MSHDFYKDIATADRKMQGRILAVLAEMAMKPLERKGDTIKPLTGAFKDCWRYRIGDYRLVFLPNAMRAEITLLAFASRGSVYGD